MFMGSSRALEVWNNGEWHTHDILQTRASEVYGLEASAPAMVGMSSQIHVDFQRLHWILADKQMQ